MKLLIADILKKLYYQRIGKIISNFRNETISKQK